jgi:DNA mismatch endonuclease (patch repair protein)
MSKIRSTGTGPETKLRHSLGSLNFVYQPRGIFGKPDFANAGARVAVFIDGCFWHRCPRDFVVPKTETGFWLEKIGRNVERDRAVNRELKKQGWRVVRVWEHDVRKSPGGVVARVRKALG